MATKNNNKEIATVDNTPAPTISERFAKTVIREAMAIDPNMQITDHMRSLIMNYFVGVDRALQAAEEARIRKNAGNKDHKYDNNVPCVWNNIDMPDLALQVVDAARQGLDILLPNHVSAIPYLDKKRGIYTVNLMEGYNGIQLKAEKYALNKPKAVTTELVYSNDRFTALKKGVDRNVESYQFEITSPFDRGEIIGGFGYIEFDDPTKNKLIIMTRKDIEKRKPAYAAAEFWGGISKRWVAGKLEEVELEGWYDEMALKTLKREVYGYKHMPLDSSKIDDAYRRQMQRETEFSRMMAEAEVAENTAQVFIDITPAEEDEEIPMPKAMPEPQKEEASQEPEAEEEDDEQLPFDMGEDSDGQLVMPNF